MPCSARDVRPAYNLPGRPTGYGHFIDGRFAGNGRDALERISPAHETPIGGMKQSGLGRETGRCGVEEYMELKSAHVTLGREPWIG